MQTHQRIAVAGVMFTYCAGVMGAPDQAFESSSIYSPNAAKRVVHQFHFDERGEGNLEELPRYWTPLRGKEFPRFTRGSFDESIGHAAAPSFHLESMGRNAAFQYNGPEIPVCSQSEYRIEGYVRMSGMNKSRVCVAAYFLNQIREPLVDTMQHTPYLAQRPQADWNLFELHLPAAPAEARFLGLILWILQEPVWDQSRPESEIPQVDVSAQAWFDDISVYRLPRLELTTRALGEVLDEHDEPALWVTLADSLGQQVEADMEIHAADGTLVMRRRLQGSVQQEHSVDPLRIDVTKFEPGLYRAQAQVMDQNQVITVRSLRFLKLPVIPKANRLSRAFGLVIDQSDRADWKTELSLLTKNAVRSIKLPVRSPLVSSNGTRGSQLESYCHELMDARFLLGAVLNGQSLQFPEEDRATELAVIAAQTAGFFRSWQLNEDGASASQPSAWKATAASWRNLLRQYISLPRLGLTVSAHDAASDLDWPAEHVTIQVENVVALDGLSERIKEFKQQGCEEVSVYAPPLPVDQYPRQARIEEWGRRLIQSRFAGADVVYSSQLWQGVPTLNGIATQPVEEYQVLRTVASMLGDAIPGPELKLKSHVRCLSFRNAEQSIIAVWDDEPMPEGRAIPLQLGSANRQVDLWGRSTALARDSNGRQLVRISQSPVLVDNVDSWLIDLATSFSIEPAIVESGAELVQHQLVINGSTGTRNGSGMFVAPPGIEVTPRRFTFTTLEGQAVRVPLTIRYPHNEPAGSKTLQVKVELVEPPCGLDIPVQVEVGTTGIEVSGQATIQHGELLLRHTVHNNSHSTANFRSIASVPGRQRQYRPISRLGPGETQTVEFRFLEATDLIGRNIYLALRELDDGPRQHNLQISVP